MNQFGIPKLIKLYQITLRNTWSSRFSTRRRTIMIKKQKSGQFLTYANDIDVIGRTPSEVIDKFLAIEKLANSVGLNVSGSKTKFVISSNITFGHRTDKIKNKYNKSVKS
uniref:Reverse transcriptase domain-containing protein n=1 Tax=Megaselia scalaris TaxID=36166 RepID=T1GVB4_MEGSC